MKEKRSPEPLDKPGSKDGDDQESMDGTEMVEAIQYTNDASDTANQYNEKQQEEGKP